MENPPPCVTLEFVFNKQNPSNEYPQINIFIEYGILGGDFI